MDEETLQLERQLERCRRLAAHMTDEEVRASLEKLADEYEARLAERAGGFMLKDRSHR